MDRVPETPQTPLPPSRDRRTLLDFNYQSEVSKILGPTALINNQDQ